MLMLSLISLLNVISAKVSEKQKDGFLRHKAEEKNKKPKEDNNKTDDNPKINNNSSSKTKEIKTVKKSKEDDDIKCCSPQTNVKMIIFDNSIVTITFTNPAIIEDVILLKKTNESDSHVVKSLTNSMEGSKSYFNKLQKLKMSVGNSDKKEYDRDYQKTLISQVKIDLDEEDFKEDVVYLFKILTWNNDEELYTEEFTYNGEEFEHMSLAENQNRWYKSVWFWIAMAALLICLALVLKLVCF